MPCFTEGRQSGDFHPIVPPGVDYAPTSLGATLLQTVQALVDWTESNQRAMAQARARYNNSMEDGGAHY
ncbi:hypothetical protein PYH37_001293 [Sinorhizobium numidicum]|uniref:HTH hxlR-type domain-containing protein n=1 Tax=Sinorhizobium numidicum TaxID=680248 RepID=A0ABY8CMP1_9HYPH|nr:hypothetical protein [Sinorhizobium numidicum]WEX73935.1 hypothetical protein PYH37_001293 [Sinorhizobium numidicum]WEX79920.1 hypothetical protein PYH38_001294 [Sinorhizobium numidicum]